MAVDIGGSGDRERRGRSDEGEGEEGRRGRRRRPVYELWIGRIPYRLRVSEFKAKVRLVSSQYPLCLLFFLLMILK